jgi:hypothetical protein
MTGGRLGIALAVAKLEAVFVESADGDDDIEEDEEEYKKLAASEDTVVRCDSNN